MFPERKSGCSETRNQEQNWNNNNNWQMYFWFELLVFEVLNFKTRLINFTQNINVGNHFRFSNFNLCSM